MLTTGTKITNGYLAQMRAKCIHHPCHLEFPNAHHGYETYKWLPSPHVGHAPTSAPPSRGSPMLTKGTTMRNGY